MAMRIKNQIMIFTFAMAGIASFAAADMVDVPATKDITFGQYNNANQGQYVQPEKTNFLVSDGNLELHRFSGSRMSAAIGGFDLSPFESITNASLYFHVVSQATGGNGRLAVQALTIDWSDATVLGDLDLKVTAGSSGNFGGGSLLTGFSTEQEVDFGNPDIAGQGFLWTGTTGTWVEVDVTDIVNNWLNDSVGSADKGLLITGGVWNGVISIGSTESTAGLAPYLQVEGTLVPEPASLVLIGCGGLVLLGRRRGMRC